MVPEGVFEAIYFVAFDLSAKPTVTIIEVDKDNAVSFTR